METLESGNIVPRLCHENEQEKFVLSIVENNIGSFIYFVMMADEMHKMVNIDIGIRCYCGMGYVTSLDDSNKTVTTLFSRCTKTIIFFYDNGGHEIENDDDKDAGLFTTSYSLFVVPKNALDFVANEISFLACVD